MFLYTLLFIFCGFLSSCFSISQQESKKVMTINGRATLEEQTFDSISINGNADLKNVTVTGLASVHGRLSAERSEFHLLKAHGNASLDHVIVHDKATVHGRLELDHSVFHKSLTAHGVVDIEDSTLHGLLKVHGRITVENSSLQAIHASAHDMIFKKSSTGLITMQSSSWSSGWSLFGWFNKQDVVEQKIELYDTIVYGDIIFEAGNGKVYLYGSSRITGTVKGGAII